MILVMLLRELVCIPITKLRVMIITRVLRMMFVMKDIAHLGFQQLAMMATRVPTILAMHTPATAHIITTMLLAVITMLVLQTTTAKKEFVNPVPPRHATMATCVQIILAMQRPVSVCILLTTLLARMVTLARWMMFAMREHVPAVALKTVTMETCARMILAMSTQEIACTATTMLVVLTIMLAHVRMFAMMENVFLVMLQTVTMETRVPMILVMLSRVIVCTLTILLLALMATLVLKTTFATRVIVPQERPRTATIAISVLMIIATLVPEYARMLIIMLLAPTKMLVPVRMFATMENVFQVLPRIVTMDTSALTIRAIVPQDFVSIQIITLLAPMVTLVR